MERLKVLAGTVPAEETRTNPAARNGLIHDAFAEYVRRSLDCGMNARAAKPIDVRKVMRLLEKYVK